MNAAFPGAGDGRSSKGSTPADVIKYVADVRSRSGDIAEKVDPDVGERLVRKVVAGEAFPFAALAADENLGSAEPDQFLARVRKMAGYLLRDA